MKNWGEIVLKKIEDGSDFWMLLEELIKDKSDFIDNKNYIIEAYRDGKMYSLTVEENEWMLRNNVEDSDLFCKHSNYLLPCFCIMDQRENENIATLLWVHSRARKKGFGSKLVKLLVINMVYNPLLESIGFWEKMGL